MGGETEAALLSGWMSTIKEYLSDLVHAAEKRLDASIAAEGKANQQRFDAQQQGVKDALTAQKEAVAAALVAAEKAVLVAETNAEKWRMNANEWRGSMLDRETKFASKDYMDAELKGLRTELQSLRESRAEGMGSKQMLGWIVSGIILLLAILGYLAKTR